ncbi:MAG: hypothetical protein ACW99A_10440 [Candidatus Kariarchaeaceae archaeon]|jgi:hypothetical protein
MSGKTSLAKDYLFFRYPTHHLLILIPIFVGTFQFFFLNDIIQVESTDRAFESQKDIMETYLIMVKLSIVVLLSFFISYRWTSIIHDGSYAYWITQGVKRMKLVYFTLSRFLSDVIFAEIIGLTLIMVVGGVRYSFLTTTYLILLILSNSIFLVVVAYSTGVFIKSPELAALTYIFINVLIMLLTLNFSIIYVDILQSDLLFDTSNALLWFAFSLITSVVILIISLLHKRGKDLEL